MEETEILKETMKEMTAVVTHSDSPKAIFIDDKQFLVIDFVPNILSHVELDSNEFLKASNRKKVLQF